jgi:hypothetical protein
LKKKPRRTSFAPGRNLRNADGKLVRTMAAAGRVEDEIAQRLGVDKNFLRRRHIGEIKAGKAVRAAASEALGIVTAEDYHFLDAAMVSFASHWFDPTNGNLLLDGIDGNGARGIADAFAAWKQQGGKYVCTGLSNRFDRRKVAQFAKIVADYRRKFERGPHRE